mmetsp:Transcript_79149/g.211540  ORF Transcript_79149/g.211540 Transcript_79149/m.211540 type:complete len:253 (-) Transcript_79149:1475-2233(-)
MVQPPPQSPPANSPQGALPCCAALSAATTPGEATARATSSSPAYTASSTTRASGSLSRAHTATFRFPEHPWAVAASARPRLRANCSRARQACTRTVQWACCTCVHTALHMPKTVRRLASSHTATNSEAARSAASRSSISPVKTPTTEYRLRTPAREPSSVCSAELAAATTAATGSSAAGSTEARLVRQLSEALRREHSGLVSPAMAVAPVDCQRAGITETSATPRSREPVASSAAGPTGAGDEIKGNNRSAV